MALATTVVRIPFSRNRIETGDLGLFLSFDAGLPGIHGPLVTVRPGGFPGIFKPLVSMRQKGSCDIGRLE